MTLSAESFDGWYADRTESPVADDLVRRMLDLPPGLQSTSLLGGAGLDEVTAALDLDDTHVLLDLACGRGGYGLEIARRTGCELIGVDFSAVAIEQAQEQAGDCGTFRVGELTATGLDSNSVDAVLIVDAFQFADPKLKALEECRRVLRPGGRLVITCWEALDPAGDVLPARMREVDLAAQLPQAGFTQVNVLEKSDWRAAEKRLWDGALAVDAGEDPAMHQMQEEARRVLANFDDLRRVMAYATA
ncbi:class I SAM-dependent methyltransferase [Lentzea alba]|uniref:class I SAM-dependent methyltransferase n=1 Tax=Lentzea alba TaxID=2714351 RepID=UPI0039BF4D9F